MNAQDINLFYTKDLIMKQSPGAAKIIVKNKKAYHLYFIQEQYETGIELEGTEVKSLRDGKVSLSDSYCKVNKNDELLLLNLNIAPYSSGGYTNHSPIRKRKLLMHKREIIKLRNKLQQKGYTLVPLSIYFKRGWAKVELGLAKGKKKFDKREDLKQKEASRESKRY